MLISIMAVMIIINMIPMTKRFNKIPSFLMILALSSCAISPGMDTPKTALFGGDFTYLKGEGGYFVPIETLNPETVSNLYSKDKKYTFTATSGDIITVTIWGIPDVFPYVQFNQVNNPQNSRLVGGDGNIFFPYIGTVKVSGLTLDEIRIELTRKLAEKFIDPQVDVTVTKFSQQRNIYVLGELARPQTISLGIEPITLADAIGKANGLSVTSSSPESIFIIRSKDQNNPVIYRIDLGNASNMILANNIFLEPKDVVFVGAAGITRWNRVIGQFFPFASFLNQIDNLSDD